MTSADDVAASMLDHFGKLEAMKLEKLVYYTQAWFLAVTGEALFDEPVEAWTYGPVVNSLFQQHKRYVDEWSGNAANVSGLARDILEAVCDQYGRMSGDELSDLTHNELPWKTTRGGLPAEAQSRDVILTSLMGQYYRSSRTLGGQYASDIAAGGVATWRGREYDDLASQPEVIPQPPAVRPLGVPETDRERASRGFRPSRLRPVGG